MNIEINEEILAELMELLETDDKDKAINLALEATTVRVRTAKPAFRELVDLYASGELDLGALEEAWRQRKGISSTRARTSESTGAPT